MLGSSGKVTIGNNCFIGMNTVILKGTTIGDNVIIVAGSILRGKHLSNFVIAGAARVICTLNEYLAKRQRAQLAEALQLVDEYYAVYHKLPAKDVLAEFFWLFEKREKIMNKSFLSKMHCVGNFDESMQVFLCEKPRFDGYDEFIAYWRKQKMV